MKKKQKHNYKSKDKFWSGSGKFLLSVMLIYLIILGINELIHHSENQCEFFYYSDIQIEGNKLIPTSQILKLCGFSKKSDSKNVKIDIHQLAKRIMNFNM